MRQLIIFITLLTVLTAKTAYSVEDFTIWKVDATVQKFNDVYFAGQDDELIIIVCDSILYRMNSENGEMLDSIYLEKLVVSSAINKDGFKIYVSLLDSIALFDVYDFSKVEYLPRIPLSGRVEGFEVRHGFSYLSISEDSKYLSCTYSEGNGFYQELYQVLIYNLESKTLEHRFDNNSSVEADIRRYYNKSMSPDESTLLIHSAQKGGGELLFYDLNKKELSTRIETKGKVYNGAEFIFLNENEVCISQSALPNYNGFNVLNMKVNLIEEYFNFKSDKQRLSLDLPYIIDSDLLLLTLKDHDNSTFRMTFFNTATRDTSINYYNIQLGAKIDIKKGKDYFISYRPSDIYLHDLNQYLTLTNVKENNDFYSIEISPNPSNNRKFSLNIKTDKTFNSDINLYNINGQLVLNIIKNKTFSLGENILEFHIPTEISSGHYYIRLESEGGSEDVKIQF